MPFFWLRRGSARVLLPVFVAVTIAAVLSRGTPWRGEWGWTVDWAGAAADLLGPLLAGAVVWELWFVGRHGVADLVPQTRRRRWAAVTLVAPLCLTAIVAQLIATGLALVLTSTTSPGGHIPVVPVVLPLVLLLGYAGIGLLVGSWIPTALAAPLTVVGAFALGLADPAGLPRLLRVGGSTGSVAGLTWSVRVAGLLMMCWLAIAAFGVAFGLLSQPGRTRAALAAVVVAFAMFVGGLVALDRASHEVLVADRGRIRFDCLGDRPTVCLADETRTHLSAVAAEADRLAQPLFALGVTVPARYRQQLPYATPDPSVGLLNLTDDPTSPVQVSGWLATPAACPQWFAPVPPIGALPVPSLIAYWLRIRSRLETADSNSPEGRWVHSGASADDWVRVSFDALRRCDLDHVSLPTGLE
ncbi:MAG: hypothetical protein JWN95_1869 [Frankiales bacterium]|nr:hypothetical protein [Frankiales bacterium]